EILVRIIDVGSHVRRIAGHVVDRGYVIGDDVLGREILVDVLTVVGLVVVAAGAEGKRHAGDDDQGSHSYTPAILMSQKKRLPATTGSLFKCQRLPNGEASRLHRVVGRRRRVGVGVHGQIRV